MKATAELQVVPIGAGVSVRAEIGTVLKVLEGYSFVTQAHASGTNIEGELDDILDALAKVHATLHEQGSVRLISYLKLETRTDKTPTLKAKQL